MKVSFKKMQLVEKKYAVFTLIGRNLELLRRGEKPLVCTSSPDVYQQLGKKLVLIFMQIQISSLSSSVYLVQVGLLILLVYNSKKDIKHFFFRYRLLTSASIIKVISTLQIICKYFA